MPMNINIKKKIVINGKEYASPEEVPPELRQVYEQALVRQGNSPQVHISTSSKFTINGQTYNSVDEMPEEARKLYESMMSRVDKNQDGIPDVLQNGQLASLGAEPSAPLAGGPAQNAPVEMSAAFQNMQNRIDAMPPEARQIFQKVMSRVDKNQDGIPDALQMDQQASLGTEPAAPLTPGPVQDTPEELPAWLTPQNAQNSTIEPDRANTRLILFSVAIIVFLLALVGLFFLVLLR